MRELKENEKKQEIERGKKEKDKEKQELPIGHGMVKDLVRKVIRKYTNKHVEIVQYAR